LDICAESPIPLSQIALRSEPVWCVLNCTLSRHCHEIFESGTKHDFCVNMDNLFRSNTALPCSVRVGFPKQRSQAVNNSNEYSGVMCAVGSNSAMLIIHRPPGDNSDVDSVCKVATPLATTHQDHTPLSCVASTALPKAASSGTSATTTGSGGLARQRSMRRRVSGPPSSGSSTGPSTSSDSHRSAWLRERGAAENLPQSPLAEQSHRSTLTDKKSSPLSAEPIHFRPYGRVGAVPQRDADREWESDVPSGALESPHIPESAPTSSAGKSGPNYSYMSPCGDSGSRTIFADLLVESTGRGVGGDTEESAGNSGEKVERSRSSSRGKAAMPSQPHTSRTDPSTAGDSSASSGMPATGWGLFSSVMKGAGLAAFAASSSTCSVVVDANAVHMHEEVSGFVGEGSMEEEEEGGTIYCSPDSRLTQPAPQKSASPPQIHHQSPPKKQGTPAASAGAKPVSVPVWTMDSACSLLQIEFREKCKKYTGVLSVSTVELTCSALFTRDLSPIAAAMAISVPSIAAMSDLLGTIVTASRAKEGGCIFSSTAACVMSIVLKLRAAKLLKVASKKQNKDNISTKSKKKDKYFGLSKNDLKSLQRVVTVVQYNLSKGETTSEERDMLPVVPAAASSSRNGLSVEEAAWLLLDHDDGAKDGEMRRSYADFVGSSSKWNKAWDGRGSRTQRLIDLMRSRFSPSLSALLAHLFEMDEPSEGMMSAPNEEQPAAGAAKKIFGRSAAAAEGAVPLTVSVPVSVPRSISFPLQPLDANALDPRRVASSERESSLSFSSIPRASSVAVTSNSPQLRKSPVTTQKKKPNALLSSGGRSHAHISHRSGMEGRLKKQHTSSVPSQTKASSRVKTSSSSSSFSSLQQQGQGTLAGKGRSLSSSGTVSLRPPVAMDSSRQQHPPSGRAKPPHGPPRGEGRGLFDGVPKSTAGNKRAHSLHYDRGGGYVSHSNIFGTPVASSSTIIVDTPVRKRARGGGIVEDTPVRGDHQ
jgi:hypothetical protein